MRQEVFFMNLRHLIPEITSDLIHRTEPSWAVKAYFFLRSRPLDTVWAHAIKEGLHPETLRRAVRRLEQSGWVHKAKTPRGRVVVPWMPEHVEELVVDRLREIREEVSHFGEWLLRWMLDIMVKDGDYGDNVRPAWLVSHAYRGRLELDRFYKSAQVAFEFQGQQHYTLTDFTPTREHLEERQKRDRIKAELCEEEGIRLIPVHASELDFQILAEKIGSSLPLMPLLEYRPLYRYLSRTARAYMHNVSYSEPVTSDAVLAVGGAAWAAPPYLLFR